jgi:hypothetical protein
MGNKQLRLELYITVNFYSENFADTLLKSQIS